MRTKPQGWAAGSIPEELFVTVLKLDNPASLDRCSQPLALLTRSAIPQLPSFVLHFGGGKNSSVHCTSISPRNEVGSVCHSATQHLHPLHL